MANLASELRNKTQDELRVIARKLKIRGVAKLRKVELVDALIGVGETAVRREINPTLWQRYHNHVYGICSAIGLVIAVVALPTPVSPITDGLAPEASAATGDVSIPLEAAIAKPRIPPSRNYELCNEIVGVTAAHIKSEGGLARFDSATDSDTLQLIKEGFAETRQKRQCPTPQQFLDFMIHWSDEVRATGYVAGPTRPDWDYLVAIDGIRVAEQDVTEELRRAFIKFCANADELRLDGDLLAWWDQ